MLFAEATDYNGMAILATALFSGLGTMITVVVTCYLQIKKMGEGQMAQAVRAEQARIAVAEVKNDLAENTVATKDTHRLVNGGMTSQLLTNVSLARQLADTTNDPTDRKIAEEAEHRLQRHIATGNSESAKGE